MVASTLSLSWKPWHADENETLYDVLDEPASEELEGMAKGMEQEWETRFRAVEEVDEAELTRELGARRVCFEWKDGQEEEEEPLVARVPEFGAEETDTSQTVAQYSPSPDLSDRSPPSSSPRTRLLSPPLELDIYPEGERFDEDEETAADFTYLEDSTNEAARETIDADDEDEEHVFLEPPVPTFAQIEMELDSDDVDEPAPEEAGQGGAGEEVVMGEEGIATMRVAGEETPEANNVHSKRPPQKKISGSTSQSGGTETLPLPEDTWTNAGALTSFLKLRGKASEPSTPLARPSINSKVVVASSRPSPQLLPPVQQPSSPPPGSIPFATPAFLLSPPTATSQAAYRIMAFPSLLQMRVHYRNLASLSLALIDRPSRLPSLPHITHDPHLVLNETTCVFFHPLAKFSVNTVIRKDELTSLNSTRTKPEALITTLFRFANRYDRILLVLEEAEPGPSRPYAYTAPVLAGLKLLKESVDELVRSNEGLEIEVVCVKSVQHSAETVRRKVEWLGKEESEKMNEMDDDERDDKPWLLADPSKVRRLRLLARAILCLIYSVM